MAGMCGLYQLKLNKKLNGKLPRNLTRKNICRVKLVGVVVSRHTIPFYRTVPEYGSGFIKQYCHILSLSLPFAYNAKLESN